MSPYRHKIHNILTRISSYKEEYLLSFVFNKYINNNIRTKYILKFKIDNPINDLIGERDLPGNECFQKNGWWRYMLLRYGLAMHFSKGKKVLETCSGLGWGAYLLDSVAEYVSSIEMDEQSINLSKQLWKTDRTEYIRGSVLKMPVSYNKYDVVTAMESIEHFSLDDIKTYLKEINRVLKSDGILIGSSSFPDTIEEADALCSKNKYHLHIYTKSELHELLKECGFKNIKIFKNNLFFKAIKANGVK